MNNNGTGLVLASLSLASRPQVMLPIIIYNLAQHLVAGAVARFRDGSQASAPSPSPPTVGIDPGLWMQLQSTNDGQKPRHDY